MQCWHASRGNSTSCPPTAPAGLQEAPRRHGSLAGPRWLASNHLPIDDTAQLIKVQAIRDRKDAYG